MRTTRIAPSHRVAVLAGLCVALLAPGSLAQVPETNLGEETTDSNLGEETTDSNLGEETTDSNLGEETKETKPDGAAPTSDGEAIHSADEPMTTEAPTTEAASASTTVPTAAVTTVPLTGNGEAPTETPSESAPTSAEPTYSTAEAPETPQSVTPWPYRQKRISVGLGLGWASSGNESWTILGVGAGINVIDGLKVGLDGTFWVGGSPFIATITPSITYAMHFVPIVQPYVGTFYRHYFVANHNKDSDSIGARLGVYFMIGRNVYMGGGAVYEHFLDDDLFTHRNSFYPELTFAVVF